MFLNPTYIISKQLLEIAKIGVKKAIENDETTATNWINQQLDRQDACPTMILFKLSTL